MNKKAKIIAWLLASSGLIWLASAPINASAQNINRESQQTHGLYFSASDINNYNRAIKFALNSDKIAATGAIETISDKILVPFIERELLLKRNDVTKEELQSWLSENREISGADMVFDRATRLFVNQTFTPPNIYPNRRSFARVRAPREARDNQIEAASEQERAAFTLAKSDFNANNDYETINHALNYIKSPIASRIAWYGGLAAFRVGEFEKALSFFTITAKSHQSDDNSRTAAAYWAARTAQKLHRFDIRDDMLEQAAMQPLSFYGQLALQKLGRWQSLNIPNQNSEIEKAKEIITNDNSAKRALALFDLGLLNDAQNELALAWNKSVPSNDLGFLFIAQSLGFKELSQRISETSNSTFIATNYPISQSLTPKGGSFVLDRALIYAIMRQESRFNASAISHAGARGLMQLMPSTAAWLTGRSELKRNPALLHDHSLNLSLGEGYLERVLKMQAIGNSLPRAIMAYNAGPGSVSRWSNTIEMSEDTLMLIEATPVSETREYVKKVMSNLWIYHKRLGQNAPTLERLAEEKSPDYEPQDSPREMHGPSLTSLMR